MGIGAARHRAGRSGQLACDAQAGGIVVDANLHSSDAAILAIGDCANFPERSTARRLRLRIGAERQRPGARCAVATIRGTPEPIARCPGSGRTRVDAPADGRADARPSSAEVTPPPPGATPASFSAAALPGRTVLCVESVNAARPHGGGQKLLKTGGARRRRAWARAVKQHL